MGKQPDTLLLQYTAQIDRAVDVGEFAEAELTDYPAWMSREAVELIERDLARHVLSCHRNRKRVAA